MSEIERPLTLDFKCQKKMKILFMYNCQAFHFLYASKNDIKKIRFQNISKKFWWAGLSEQPLFGIFYNSLQPQRKPTGVSASFGELYSN